MKMKVIYLGLSCLSMFLSPVYAKAIPPSKMDPASIVNASIKKIMEKDHIPGVAVNLYVNGQAYSYYYGYRDLTHKLKVNDKTLFEIGSITNLFTSLLLAVEINQNNMKLTDSLGLYLPSLKGSQVPAANITLEQLATHTSGLPLDSPLPQTDLFNINTVASLHQFLWNWKPNCPIGSQWQYSNFGMGLLGMSIEDKVGWPYKELLNKYIFKPLKINDATIDQSDWRYNYAQGYFDGKAVKHWKMPMFPAASAIEASPRDMQNFLAAAIQLPGTPEVLVTAMKLTQTPYVQTSLFQQGLGWMIYPFTPQTPKFNQQPSQQNLGPVPASQINTGQARYNGDLLMQKDGATNGFKSYIAVLPNAKTGIVILANSYLNNNDVENAGRSILAQLTHS